MVRKKKLELPESELMTFAEAAKYAGVLLPAISKAVHRGKLPVVEITVKVKRISKDALDYYIRNKQKPGRRKKG